MFKLSVCIPTYNRAVLLKNCLQSIIAIKSKSKFRFQVCVSDNCSTDDTHDVIIWAQQHMTIKYQKNTINVGMAQNFLNVVQMADGEFIWMIGDDDLLLPNAMEKLFSLFENNPKVDFFYINSFNLTTEYVLSFSQPFKTTSLPQIMAPFSSFKKSGEIDFLNLIDPKMSFDFLGGIFLAVFKREKWMLNINVLDKNAISDLRTFSHFDNSFPHLKIFANAFPNSRAYFNADPLSVCLKGAREWAAMNPLIMSVRLVEALNEYRKNGLSYFQYLYCRNYALKNFNPDILYMIFHKNTGLEYINPIKLIFTNCLFPNFYLSFINFVIRKFVLYYRKVFPKIQKIRVDI
jgi:glycosyltransferase involved in cell wall biosynthesis